ncbi:hypothetical protein EVAR_41872_1 [Eumeta japonica]|uniref:Uncharacterized protein n=1 Tax=Eumeta variegata TaxID=151549 RepID=A0A4C1X8Q2_EUMVA|nr:hypothetical protein EVAR_41872_1 [Eumeta japonica]
MAVLENTSTNYQKEKNKVSATTTTDAKHTPETCPVWAVQRTALIFVVGNDLPLPTIVERIIGNDESWEAARTFCEKVISQKDAVKRKPEDRSVRNPSPTFWVQEEYVYAFPTPS